MSCLANGCVTFAAAVLKAPGDKGVNQAFREVCTVWPREMDGPVGDELEMTPPLGT